MPAGDIYGEKILDLSTGLGSIAPSLSVVGGGGKRGGDAFAKFNVGDLVLVTPGDRYALSCVEGGLIQMPSFSNRI